MYTTGERIDKNAAWSAVGRTAAHSIALNASYANLLQVSPLLSNHLHSLLFLLLLIRKELAGLALYYFQASQVETCPFYLDMNCSSFRTARLLDQARQLDQLVKLPLDKSKVRTKRIRIEYELRSWLLN